MRTRRFLSTIVATSVSHALRKLVGTRTLKAVEVEHAGDEPGQGQSMWYFQPPRLARPLDGLVLLSCAPNLQLCIIHHAVTAFWHCWWIDGIDDGSQVQRCHLDDAHARESDSSHDSMPEIWRGIPHLENQDNDDGNHVHDGNDSVIQNALMTLDAEKTLFGFFRPFFNISFLDASGGFVGATDFKPKLLAPAQEAKGDQSLYSIPGEVVGKPDVCRLASSQVPEDTMVNGFPVRPRRKKPAEGQNQDHVEQGMRARSCNDWPDRHGDEAKKETTQSADSVKPWAKTVMKHGEALHKGSTSEAFVEREFQFPRVTDMASPLPSSVMFTLAMFYVTHPTTTLFQMTDDAVRLDAPLKDLMDECNLPTSAVKQPAGDQILRNGELGESTNVKPCIMSNDETTAWAPRCIDAVTKTIICARAGHICLIQRVIIRDVVVMLLIVNLCHGYEEHQATHLCTCHHTDPVVDQDMRNEDTKNAGFRNHISIEYSFELSWLIEFSDGGVEVASLVSMVLFSLLTGPIVKVVVFYLDTFTSFLQLHVLAIIGEDDSESVSGIVDLQGCFHSVEDDVSWFTTRDDEEINERNFITQEAKGRTWDFGSLEANKKSPKIVADGSNCAHVRGVSSQKLLKVTHSARNIVR